MKSVTTPIDGADIQSYVDGRLSAEECVAFERALEEQPALAERVASYVQHRELLRSALLPKLRDPVPAHLRIDNIARRLASSRRQRFSSLAAAGAWLLVGAASGSLGTTLATGWSVQPPSAGPIVAGLPMADALVAHRVYVADAKHPIEVGADERAHLQTWLSKRLGRQLTAPDLSMAGYELLGGRLLPASSGPAALFMYENGKGARMTVYVRSSDRDEAPVKLIDDQGLRAGYWYNDGYGFAVSAEEDRAVVLRAAASARSQLNT